MYLGLQSQYISDGWSVTIVLLQTLPIQKLKRFMKICSPIIAYQSDLSLIS